MVIFDENFGRKKLSVATPKKNTTTIKAHKISQSEKTGEEYEV